MDTSNNIPARIGFINFCITPVDRDTGNPIYGANFVIYNNSGIYLQSDGPTMNQPGLDGWCLENIDVNQDLRLKITAPGYQDLVLNSFDIINLGNDSYLPMDKSKSNFLPLALAGLALLAVTEDKKIGAINDGKNSLINAGILIGGGYVLIKSIGIADNLLELLGLQKSVETRTLDFASTDPNSFWNPNFWRQFTNWNYALTANQARSIISQLEYAFSWFNDDEAAAMAALKQLKTQSNLSYISYVFSIDKGKDFLTWLRGNAYPADRLSDAEIYDLHNYIAKLPTH